MVTLGRVLAPQQTFTAVTTRNVRAEGPDGQSLSVEKKNSPTVSDIQGIGGFDIGRHPLDTVAAWVTERAAAAWDERRQARLAKLLPAWERSLADMAQLLGDECPEIEALRAALPAAAQPRPRCAEGSTLWRAQVLGIDLAAALASSTRLEEVTQAWAQYRRACRERLPAAVADKVPQQPKWLRERCMAALLARLEGEVRP